MAESDKPNWFARVEEGEDEEFYSTPRRVVHIDEGAIAAIGEIYLSRIAEGSKILDLMSSWRSHLPERMRPAYVTGLGMNREEMEDNPALDEVVVHNVNRNARLPFPDESFDAVVMTVSVQYLTNPIATFREIARVLRPGGCFVTTFSNRMFPTKAVALWRGSSEENRVEIVKQYFAQSGAFENIGVIDMSHHNGPPSDPIWGVLGYRPQ